MSSWLIFALLSAVFAALTAILAKIGVQGINSNLATAIRTTVILIFAWGIVFVTRVKTPPDLFEGKTFLFLVLSAITTGISWLFYFRALQLGTASHVSSIDRLSLVFTVFLAVLILGEKLSLPLIVGMVLMVSGALLIGFSR